MSLDLFGEPLSDEKRKKQRARLKYLIDRPGQRKTTVRILHGDVRKALAMLSDESIYCVVTSPPYYGLRNYNTPPQVWGGDLVCRHEWEKEQTITRGLEASRSGMSFESSHGSFCQHCGAWTGHLGLEPSPSFYIQHLVEIFHEVRRVLRKDGTFWLNIADSYRSSGGQRSYGSFGNAVGRATRPRFRPGAELADGIIDNRNQRNRNGVHCNEAKVKDLIGIPWMLAFALRDDGWWLRSEITWCKRAPMPESVTDRPTRATESIFLLTKNDHYFYDAEAIKEEAETGTELGFLRGKAEQGDPRDSYTTNTSAMRNMRNFWLLNPEPISDEHYAVFPTEIPRRAILAGTSAKGVCAKCGAPWERITHVVSRTGTKKHGIGVDRTKGRAGETRISDSTWQPSCVCETADPIPATILDPFLGSGTSAIVSAQLQCNAIGIELSDEYVAMARKNLAQDAELIGLATVSVEEIS